MVDILDTSARPAPALSATSDAPVLTPAPAPAAEPEPVVEDPKIGAALEDADIELPDQTPPEDGEGAEEPAPAVEEPPAERPARRTSYGDRLSRLTQQRDEATRVAEELAAANRRLMDLQRPAPQQQQQPEPEPPPEPELPRPRRQDFADPDAYDDALIAYTEARADLRAAQRVAQERAADAQRQEQQRIEEGNNQIARNLNDGWEKVQTRGVEKHPDFVEKVREHEYPMTIPMLNALVRADNGEEVVYHLATNPEEAARIAGMVVPGQIMQGLPPLPDGSPNPLNGQPLPDFPAQTFAMGQLAARLAATPPTPVSRAPRPITPVRGNNGAVPRTLAEIAETGSTEEYAAARQAQLDAERGSRPQPKFGRAH